ncbi:carbohydrate sulfotransferase 15-like [Lineus longissimus]|uniref:carbohydrate sulfotransferase 15-like n=1 Tax=Lineus longissimus TaxID=88925 RepID=UPI002B4E629C
MMRGRQVVPLAGAILISIFLVNEFTSLCQETPFGLTSSENQKTGQVVQTRRLLAVPLSNGSLISWGRSLLPGPKKKEVQGVVNLNIHESDTANEESDNAVQKTKKKSLKFKRGSVEQILRDLQNGRLPTQDVLASEMTKDAGFDIPTPLPVDPNWKNPCWVVRGALHCLPYFYVIGFPNSGTTDLFSRITMHPHVLPTFARRTNIWTIGRTLDMPLSRFSHLCGLPLFTRGQSNKQDYILGDDSLMVADHAMTAKRRPYGPAHFIKRYTPNAKFIVLLRDPAARAFSQYTKIDWDKNREKSPYYFNILLEKVIGLARTCMKTASARACAFNKRLRVADNQMSIIWNGMYAVYLAEWLQVFPRENFLFVKSENFSMNTGKVIQDAYTFLGLDRLSDDVIATISSAPKQHHHAYFNDNIGPLSAKSRKLLDEFYAPFTKALEDIIGESLTQ